MLFLAIGGIIVKLFLSGGISKDGLTGPASATIWGYGLTSMALIGLLLGVINLSSKETLSLGLFDMLKKLFSSSFPIISTLVYYVG